MLSVSGACLSLQNDDFVEIEVKTIAVMPTPLVAPPVDVEAVSYRWEVALQPMTVQVTPPPPGASATFTPPLRGEYQFDRYAMLGITEDLTHRFFVTAAGTAPVAIVMAERPIVRVGEIVRIDASMSYSPENLPLSFRWERIASPSPIGGFANGPSIEFYANAEGYYSVELNVTCANSLVRVNVFVQAKD